MSKTKQEPTFEAFEDLLTKLGLLSGSQRNEILNYAADLKDVLVRQEVTAVLEELEKQVSSIPVHGGTDSYRPSHYLQAVKLEAIQSIKERYNA